MPINDNLLSIIVPVHNGEKTIRKCILSLVQQQYKNIEVLVINDNSDDHTSEILIELSKQYSCIRVIDLKEGSRGVSFVRNQGLKQAKGDIVGFVDADDYVSLDMFEQMISHMIQQKADIVMCTYFFQYEDYSLKCPTEKFGAKYNKTFSSEEAVLELMKSEDAVFTGHVWDKIYRRSVIEDILFSEEVHCFEDTLFNVEAILNSNNIFFFNQSLYYYFINCDSVTNRGYSDKYFSSLKALRKIENLVASHCNNTVLHQVQKRIIQECIVQSYMCLGMSKENYYLRSIKDILKEYQSKIKLLHLPFKLKCQVFLLIYVDFFYRKIITLKPKKYLCLL